MHRQSLGSPSTKQQQLPLHHSPSKHQQPPPYSSSSASSSSSLSGNESGEEEKELKKLKLLKTKTKTTKPENYIHLIPLLTLLCFLILYLSSHNPHQNDLAQFNDFNPLHNPSEENMSELQRVVEIKSGDILAIRRLKNIVRRNEVIRRRLHRKIIADF